MSITSGTSHLPRNVRQAIDSVAMIRDTLLENTGKESLIRDFELKQAAELRVVLEQMIRLLDAYLQATAGSGKNVVQLLEWYKAELALELMETLRPGGVPGEVSGFTQLVNHAIAKAAQHAQQTKPY